MRGRRKSVGQSTESLAARKFDAAAARNTAIGLLARREHAGSEIKRKLHERGYDAEITAEIVDELSRKRLISDERFAEVFIRSRATRGQGPVRLKAELRHLKVPTELIERYLGTIEIAWSALAAEARARKFGKILPDSMAERAKQVRFLQYRGFTADQIRAALGARCEDNLLEVVADGDSPDIDPIST